MLRILCICVIIDGLASVPLALLSREFAQGRRMVVDSVNFADQHGRDGMARLFRAGRDELRVGFPRGLHRGFMLVATAVAPHVIMPGWKTAHARQLLQFGLPLAGASLFTLGVVNVDSAIVGHMLGPASLGLYQLAFNISSWPVSSISQAVERISFAGFSRVADSGKGLADTFARATGLLMAMTVPACVLLATLAEPLIRALYGARWVPAAHALSLLAILGLMRVAYGLFYDGLAVVGWRNTLMGIQALWLAALVPVLIVGARLHGITGVSAGHILVAAGLVGPAFLWALSRAGITVRATVAPCVRPVLGGALMAAVSLIVIRLAGGGVPGLALAIAAGFAVYLPVVYPMRALLRSSPALRGELDEPSAA